MYNIYISSRAKREIKKLDSKSQVALMETLRDIKENPFSGKALTRKLSGRFSYRVGVYRIIYKVRKKDKAIIVLTAGHRSVVYD